jgi:hypothetical protein
MDEPNQVEIGKVQTEVVVTEGVGPLSRADVQRIVSLVLEHVRNEQDRNDQREKDTGISNRVFPPAVR